MLLRQESKSCSKLSGQPSTTLLRSRCKTITRQYECNYRNDSEIGSCESLSKGLLKDGTWKWRISGCKIFLDARRKPCLAGRSISQRNFRLVDVPNLSFLEHYVQMSDVENEKKDWSIAAPHVTHLSNHPPR